MHPIVNRFLSSAFFAEDDAANVVPRLIDATRDPDERAALVAYAQEEQHHAELIDAYLARHGIEKGSPFVIQRFFHVARSRSTMLLQGYHVELLAGVFYGAVAARSPDPEAAALLKRLLRDEAGHVRLHRTLAAREVARLSPARRARARAIAAVMRRGAVLTAWLQARQLAPLLGDAAAREIPKKLARLLRADAKRLFAPAEEPRALPPLRVAVAA